MAIADQNPPREGTKAAVRYWAARTRQAMRFAQTMLAEGELESAATWSNDAAGCAGEFEAAVSHFTGQPVEWAISHKPDDGSEGAGS